MRGTNLYPYTGEYVRLLREWQRLFSTLDGTILSLSPGHVTGGKDCYAEELQEAEPDLIVNHRTVGKSPSRVQTSNTETTLVFGTPT